MDLYFNCYNLGDGYTLGRIHRVGQEEGTLETIRLKDIPAHLVSSFVQENDDLCLGQEGEIWYGCAKNVPSFLKDEANRDCFLNIALSAEPGSKQEEEAVRAIMAFARDHKTAFSAYLSRVIYYPAFAYAVDLNALDALTATALAENDGVAEPFTCAEGNWVSAEPDRNVFFYCATPSMGYVLRKIEPSSGLAYRFGTKKGMTAASQLLPYERKLLDNGGADMALFEQNGRCCFIVKGVTSAGVTKENGKKLSFLMDVPVGEEAWLTRLASYALFSPASFMQLLTDCVEIYSDPRGFRVLPEKLQAFFSVFDHAYRLPDNTDRETRQLWKQVSAPRKNAGFRFVVLETTYEYFERLSGISVSDGDGAALIMGKQAEKLAAQAMQLLPAEGGASQEEKPLSSPKAQRAPEPDDGGKSPDGLVLEEKRGARQNETPEEEPDAAPEEERVDLLKYKWFLPCVITVLLLFVAAIVLFILFGNKQGGLP